MQQDSGIEALPSHVLGRIMQELRPAQLHVVEETCRRLRATVVEQSLWRRLCIEGCPSLCPLLGRVHAELVAEELRTGGGAPLPQQHAESAFFKRLAWRLGTPPDARCTLADQALGASSTDNPEERIDNVLTAESRSRGAWRVCYWSSAGSQSASACDHLSFALMCPLALVHAVHIRPFRAYFQPGGPIYAPRALRVTLGGRPCFYPCGTPMPRAAILSSPAPAPFAGAAGAADPGSPGGAPPPRAAAEAAAGSAPPPVAAPEPCGAWSSGEMAVEKSDALQAFALPPTLCVGGHVRLDLLGRTQTQCSDDCYYVCLAHVRVVGVPLFDFAAEPAPGGGACLHYIGARGAELYGRRALPVIRRTFGEQEGLEMVLPPDAAAAGGGGGGGGADAAGGGGDGVAAGDVPPFMLPWAVPGVVLAGDAGPGSVSGSSDSMDGFTDSDSDTEDDGGSGSESGSDAGGGGDGPVEGGQ